jgi:hypothetical protein
MDDSPEASGVHNALPARTLGAIVEHAGDIQPVLKADLSRGDWVVVVTKNSTYSICFLGGESYSVAGGWFDQNSAAPLTVSINGCTWGGSAIKSDILAAPGLFLEFGNRVRTTRIQQVTVHQSDGLPTFN